MWIDLFTGPEKPDPLAALDEAWAVTGEVRERLLVLAVQARATAAGADWQAPSARRFHERMTVWADTVAAAEAEASAGVDALARARADRQARMWQAAP